jgi:hypothetical protein
LLSSFAPGGSYSACSRCCGFLSHRAPAITKSSAWLCALPSQRALAYRCCDREPPSNLVQRERRGCPSREGQETHASPTSRHSLAHTPFVAASL